ncbi:hypothetical protein [Wolbachia endosymbiont of Zaprionus taronus]|uniref:hypothetical protein n=1 Tax=Wolbachia endosymbiont of Zaprionus taronus TaxID=2603208 RepID=UPI00294A8802|nr:hypothetical protein [Wolbachia endosymbiont of Zaprionus taronus]MDV6248727.1 hypothetical protein [Wolbachia endosymbiont of Zaprionus taronus]
MIDIASIGVSTVIDQNYRRKAQLCLSGLFVTVSIATVTWFIFPASQNVLAPFLLPAMFLLFTLSMGYYMFIFSCEEKSLVKNVLGMVEPDESVKRVHCQENIKSLLAEVRSTTKDRFRNVLVNLCFEDPSKAHKLALYVKEIDDIVSSIKNKDLLDHFDQFFTITEVSNKKNRSELMNLARAYKMISEEDPDKIQDFLATQTKSYSYEIMLPEIDNFLSQAR